MPKSALRKSPSTRTLLLRRVRFLRSKKGHKEYGGNVTIKLIRQTWPWARRPSYYMVRKLLKVLENEGYVWYSSNGVVGMRAKRN